jgi:hypothetical protein
VANSRRYRMNKGGKWNFQQVQGTARFYGQLDIPVCFGDDLALR